MDLDERQVMQLHSAMVGAFGAVIHFLKRVAVDTKVQVGQNCELQKIFVRFTISPSNKALGVYRNLFDWSHQF